jgi:Tol biopolymer transport system component
MKQLMVASAWLVLLGSGVAQVTERLSVSSGGAEANGGGDLPSPSGAVISADGRYMAFMSAATNIVPGDMNATWDVFLRDRQNGTTEFVSLASNGAQGNGFSGQYGIAVTPDARFVAFYSRANNLVAGDTNGASDIFLRDRSLGLTERVSVASGGTQGNNNCFHLALSANGRFVAFESLASNFIPGDTNNELDIFLRDRLNGTTELVSISMTAAPGNAASQTPSISADGRYVAFTSEATNIVPGDTNNHPDVFVRDCQSGNTQRASVSTGSTQGNGNSVFPWISSTGRYVSFTSDASNLIVGDTNGFGDIFVRDLRNDTTERASVAAGNLQGNGSSWDASMSADGRLVAFTSNATNLVSTGTAGLGIYVRDRMTDTTEVVSVATDGSPANGNCEIPAVSGNGRYVAFRSSATNLILIDTNASDDVFIHDRAATGFTSLCDPGVAGSIGCPCSNPPGGLNRGCDNASATGGASLSATGIAYLSTDSLVFTTGGEPPTATSILLQGNAFAPSGIVFGQGVRCAGGTIKRLFTKIASGGSVTAPDFSTGDPSVSARSAAHGDVIRAGQSRWYLVYYRDPSVLGGCPASSTFNSTQTGQITWWP